MNISTHSFGTRMVKGGTSTDQLVNTKTMSCHHDRQYGPVAGVGRFLWHLAQMVVAMQVGMVLFRAVLCAQLMAHPVLHEALMDLFMALPMLAVMGWHGHCWQRSAEMVGAMLTGPAILIACVMLNAGSQLPWPSVQMLPTLTSVTMYLGMLIAMLYRRADYAC